MLKISIESLKTTAFLRLYSLFKIPLIAFVSPRVIESTNTRTELVLPLVFRTKNHLGVMYFGALNIGAELSIALTAVKKIYDSGQHIDFLFKDFKANFLKRAEGDVHFICEEVGIVVQQVQEAAQGSERINRTIKAYALVPSVSPTEKIAEFELTLSMRKRLPKK